MSAELVVSSAHASRLLELAERLGRPAEQLLSDALDRYLDEPEHEHKPAPASESGFDEVVFGDGEDALRFSAEEFRALPLRRQVHLLLTKPLHFYRGGREIPREQAMSLRGLAKS